MVRAVFDLNETPISFHPSLAGISSGLARRLNYSLSGLPYWTIDIGGFISRDPDDPAYRELFVRWFQFGTFNPILRIHGTRTVNQDELWSSGLQAQKMLMNFDKRRYRLLPYI
jgi:alpha-D-xyloside xylohydrolase